MTTTPAAGDPAPDFSLPATGDQTLSLGDYAGQILVLYFYPKDSTPGCTQEGQEFRDLYPRFREAGADILGVSRDSVASHERFRAKQAFPFHLLADTDETLCRAYDVIREKDMYGRKVMGIERSTFVIDGRGIIRHALRKVRAKGHAEAVLQLVRELADD